MLIFLYLHHSRYAKMKIVSACWRSRSSSSSTVAYINKNDERLELGIKSSLRWLYIPIPRRRRLPFERASQIATEGDRESRREREKERSKGYIYT